MRQKHGNAFFGGKDTLFNLSKEKASKPNGFTMAFWQACQNIINDDAMVFKEFFNYVTFQRFLNTTFLVLIPKKTNAEELKDFKPINSVKGLYKLSTKVLANRLKNVTGKVVLNYQYAYVKGKQILNEVLVTNKAIDSRLKCSMSGVLCKINIRKAQNYVNWNFLISILHKMDFGKRQIRRISWCITIAKFSILVFKAPQV